jgi:transcription initiation factor TFIIA large subunit
VSSDNEEEEQVAHVVIAQFDKVSHVKTKWKCQLKDGVMRLNGRDYLFHSANGEMQF